MIDQILVVAGITFFIMISPGPDMVIVLRNTLAGGRSAGLRTSAGILAGNTVHISYCVLGIGLLISQSILAFTALKYAAAAYLIFLGFSSFRTGGTSLDANVARAPRPKGRWLVQGFLNNILNPKGTLFYLGVFTMVITPGTSPAQTLVLILCMTLVSATFWLVFVYTLDQPFVRTALESGQRSVNRVFGVLLVALGVRVAMMQR